MSLAFAETDDGALTLRRRLWSGVAILVLLTLLAEAGAQALVYGVFRQGKIYQSDRSLGWTLIPNLDRLRLNANDDLYHIVTGETGRRGAATFASESNRRILVTGDSFAMGEGIDLPWRFDEVIRRSLRSTAVVNVAVGGYGPDQQLIATRPLRDELRPGDLLLILTSRNDFLDVQRRRFAGRSKPWFELRDGKLVEHGPEIDAFQFLRNRSYLWAWTAAQLERQRLGPLKRNLSLGVALYRDVVWSETADLVARDVEVLIARHGLDDTRRFGGLLFDGVFERLCRHENRYCLSLDDELARHPGSGLFLRDGHWTRRAHEIAGLAIASYIREAVWPAPERSG